MIILSIIGKIVLGAIIAILAACVIYYSQSQEDKDGLSFDEKGMSPEEQKVTRALWYVGKYVSFAFGVLLVNLVLLLIGQVAIWIVKLLALIF